MKINIGETVIFDSDSASVVEDKTNEVATKPRNRVKASMSITDSLSVSWGMSKKEVRECVPFPLHAFKYENDLFDKEKMLAVFKFSKTGLVTEQEESEVNESISTDTSFMKRTALAIRAVEVRVIEGVTIPFDIYFIFENNGLIAIKFITIIEHKKPETYEQGLEYIRNAPDSIHTKLLQEIIVERHKHICVALNVAPSRLMGLFEGENSQIAMLGSKEWDFSSSYYEVNIFPKD